MVVETMMAKNRENRYRNPDDLILDLKCLLQGESPMIAGQKAESLAKLSQGEAAEMEAGGATEAQLVEIAGYVNSRNEHHRRVGHAPGPLDRHQRRLPGAVRRRPPVHHPQHRRRRLCRSVGFPFTSLS